MASNLAAGLLMCRKSDGELEYFLVHPGGPFFKKKNEGIWTIPKGVLEGSESLIRVAQREFQEETGLIAVPPLEEIGFIKQKAGKVVHAWTFLGEWNSENGIVSNSFSMEWPPRSGRMVEFPEMDQARWMKFEEAAVHIIPEQIPFLERAKRIHV
ncbi:MAG: NUDIX domain-containing protein [Cyclobacteriaceae bacterium]